MVISDANGNEEDSFEVAASSGFRDEVAAYRHDHRHHVKNSYGVVHEAVPHAVLEGALAHNWQRTRLRGRNEHRPLSASGLFDTGGTLEILPHRNPDKYVGEDGIARRHSETQIFEPRNKYHLEKDDLRRHLPKGSSRW